MFGSKDGQSNLDSPSTQEPVDKVVFNDKLYDDFIKGDKCDDQT